MCNNSTNMYKSPSTFAPLVSDNTVALHVSRTSVCFHKLGTCFCKTLFNNYVMFHTMTVFVLYCFSFGECPCLLCYIRLTGLTSPSHNEVFNKDFKDPRTPLHDVENYSIIFLCIPIIPMNGSIKVLSQGYTIRLLLLN